VTGRTLTMYEAAGGEETFTRLVEEYPESPFTGDAKKELDGLKKT